MARQTELGKAFEYACVDAFYKKYSKVQEVELEETAQMETARKFYRGLAYKKKLDLTLAAKAAVRIIEWLEPQLKYPGNNMPLIITLQTDAEGIAGDVRDVLCIRKKNSWQIGLSCKHNHHAVKHSRLSATINFGKDWFGKTCSDQYFSQVVPLFTQLKVLRDESKAMGKPMLWSEIEDKFDSYYVPILKAFMEELKRIDKQYPGEIPELLIRYLIGKYDFYKVITDDRHRATRVEAVNIGGTLNKNSDAHETLVKVPILKMPSKFYHIDFKENSKNTIEVVCDEGWTVSMRLHNASSKVEPSLKFDVNLISLPSSIHAQVEPWDVLDEMDEDEYTSINMVAEDKGGYYI